VKEGVGLIFPTLDIGKWDPQEYKGGIHIFCETVYSYMCQLPNEEEETG